MHEDDGGPTWRPLKRARAHELVMEAIEEQIMAGALRVGDPLPPERELAARLQVSRAGVREAVRVLEGDGVLRSRTGAGAEAGTFVDALPREALTRLLRLHVALTNFAVEDVIEARLLLEASSAVNAADRAGEAAVEVMRDALERMEVDGVSQEAFNDADTDFHLALAEAGGNELAASLTAAIRGALRTPILRAIRRSDDWPTVSAELRRQHRELFDAIRAGEGVRAGELAAEHIRYSQTALPDPGPDAATTGVPATD